MQLNTSSLRFCNERCQDRIAYPESEVKPLAWFGSPLTADELLPMRARALLQLKCRSEYNDAPAVHPGQYVFRPRPKVIEVARRQGWHGWRRVYVFARNYRGTVSESRAAIRSIGIRARVGWDEPANPTTTTPINFRFRQMLHRHRRHDPVPNRRCTTQAAHSDETTSEANRPAKQHSRA